MAILSCVRSSREISFCIHPFVVMRGDRPTNESNRSGGDGDRFWTGTKYDQLPMAKVAILNRYSQGN
ncbi:MAG: hypothetical protein KME52_10465 [Desmonostoc geniculatum HA4340-LM1]|jgi:hypothetical protein|nr:hypothetical protein [Desmonostoc geniculatum HA4340-LM1]